MLSKPHRFHGHASLRYVYRHGKTVRGPFVALKYAVNERRQQYRAAVVVSRKVSKSAVVRNRIRRRIYELLRAYEPELTEPYDLVITVFDEAVALQPHVELQQTIDGLLRQSGIVIKAARRHDKR